MPVTDKEILSKFNNPNEKNEGFNLLIQAYQERVYWHVRKMVIDHDDANDVVQDVFIKVWKNLHKFRGESALYTYLYRISTNESITFLNKKKRRAATSIENEEGIGNILKADEYFEGDEITIKLQMALSTLPEKQKAVFNLRYYNEMSYEDMSKTLKTSVGALKASYHHAVKKIERYLIGD